MKRFFPILAAALAALCVIFSCVAPVGFTPEGAIKVDATVEGEISVTTPDAVLLVHNHLKSMDVQTLEIVDNDIFSIVAQANGRPKAGFQKMFSLRPKSTAYTVTVKLKAASPAASPNPENRPEWQWSGDGVEKSYEIFLKAKGLYNLHLFRHKNGSIGLTSDPAEYNRDKTSEDDQMSRTDPDDGKEGETDPDPGEPPDMRYGLLVFKNMAKYQDIERVYFAWYEDPTGTINLSDADKLYTMSPGPSHQAQRSIQLGPNDWRVHARYRIDGMVYDTEETVVTVYQSGQEWYAYFYKNLDGEYAITTEWPPADLANENTAFIPVTNIGGLVSNAVKDQILTLTGQVEPANAGRQNVLFSVKSGGNIPLVFVEDNRIKPMGTGTIQMLATVSGGAGNGVDYIQPFSINVGLVLPDFIPVTNITGIPATLTAGQTLALDGLAVINPSDATNRAITWSYTGSVPSGLANPLTGSDFSAAVPGKYTILATVANGKSNTAAMPAESDYTKSFDITVEAAPYIPVMNINGTNIQNSMYVNQSLALTGNIVPATATAIANGITWTVSPASHASISGSTLNTNSNTGLITVTATVTNGVAVGQNYTKTFNITVEQPPVNLVPVTGIDIQLRLDSALHSSNTVIAGKQYAVSGVITPSNATHQNIIWSVTSNGGTGSITSGGSPTLTPGQKGGIKLTATIKDESNNVHYSITRNLTVFVPASSVTRISPPAKARLGYRYPLAGTVNASATNTAIGSWGIATGGSYANVSTESGNYYFTGTAIGTAALQATVTNGETPTANKTLPAGSVNIIAAESTDTTSPGLVILGPDTVYVAGGTVTYTGRPIPIDASVTKTWKITAGTSHASINPSTGVLTPLSAGTVTIAASCTAGTSTFEVYKTVTIASGSPPPQAYLKVVRKDSSGERIADITGYGIRDDFSLISVRENGQSTYSLNSSTANPLAAADRKSVNNFRQEIPVASLTTANSSWITTVAQGKYLVAFTKTTGAVFGYSQTKWLALDIPWFLGMGIGTHDNPIVLEVDLSSNSITIPTNPANPISGKAWIKVTMDTTGGNMFFELLGYGYGTKPFTTGRDDGASGISIGSPTITIDENNISTIVGSHTVPISPYNPHTLPVWLDSVTDPSLTYGNFERVMLVNIEPHLLAYRTSYDQNNFRGYNDAGSFDKWFLLDVGYTIGAAQVSANGLGSYANPIEVVLDESGNGIYFPGGGGPQVGEAYVKFLIYTGGYEFIPNPVYLYSIRDNTYFNTSQKESGNSGITVSAGLPQESILGNRVDVEAPSSWNDFYGPGVTVELPIGRYLLKIDFDYRSGQYVTGYNTSYWFLLDLPYKLGTTSTPATGDPGSPANPIVLNITQQSIRYNASTSSGDTLVRFIRTDDNSTVYITDFEVYKTPATIAANPAATDDDILAGNSKILASYPDDYTITANGYFHLGLSSLTSGGSYDISISGSNQYLLRYYVQNGTNWAWNGYRGISQNLFLLDTERWAQLGFGTYTNPILIYVDADGMEFSPEMTEEVYVSVIIDQNGVPNVDAVALYFFNIGGNTALLNNAGDFDSGETNIYFNGISGSPINGIPYTVFPKAKFNNFVLPMGTYLVASETEVNLGASGNYYSGFSPNQWFILDTEYIHSQDDQGYPGTASNPITIHMQFDTNGLGNLSMNYGPIYHPHP